MSIQLTGRDLEAIKTEYTYREARASYYKYLQIAEPGFIPSKLHELIATEVQSFIENPNPSPSYDVFLISMPPQVGKGYPVDWPVLTTTGWKKHGDLRIGDYVFNAQGWPVRVIATQVPYMHPCMEVNFRNGEQHIVTREHLWDTSIGVVETQSLINSLDVKIKKAHALHTSDDKRLTNMYRVGLEAEKNGGIPTKYFFIGPNRRKEILRGVVDACGWQDNSGGVQLSSRNSAFLDDVWSLARACGLNAIYHVDHQYITFRTNHFVSRNHQNRFIHPHVESKYHWIQSVKPVGDRLVSCITVEGNIYLSGRGLIPTHNSRSITETLPSWFVGKNPLKDVIIVSYSSDTASKFGRSNRIKLEQFTKAPYDVVGPLFPNYQIGEVWNNDDICNTNNKYIRSRGIMGGITSNPADLIIIDDPIKTMQEARSETTREAIWSEYYASVRTRIKPHGKLIVVATRWIEDDLIGRLMSIIGSRRLRVLFIPCECVDPEHDPLGRALGDSICPEIGRDNAWLQEFKSEYIGTEGLYTWSAMYQCDPTPIAGAIVKPEWWQYYDYTEDLQFSQTYISVDCTFKGTDTSDYVAIQVWSMVGKNYYLRTQERDQMSFTETVERLRDVIDRYPDYVGILIEDKANGSAVIDTLQSEYNSIIPVTPAGGKESRLHSCSKLIRQGRVFLPRSALFTESYIREFTSFPSGKHDDQVDSTTQVLNYMLYTIGIDNTNTSDDKRGTIRIRAWDSDMYEDYYAANAIDRERLLTLWGYPIHGFNEEEM